MLRGHLRFLTLSLSLFGASVSASEPPQPAVSPATLSPAAGSERPAESALPVAGLTPEFAQRLATADGRLSAAERADRGALARFYETRQSEPVWVGSDGLTPAGAAVVAEIGRAGDWGLDASAFLLPAALPPAGETTREQRADAEIAISLAVLRYAHHARGGRVDPLRLSRNLDRSPRLIEPGEVIAAAAKSDAPDAYLRSLHPQHPQFERLRQYYLALRQGPLSSAVLMADGPPQEDRKAGKKRAAGGKTSKGSSKTVAAQPGIRKLLANMEQWRWMPEDLGRFHVWVNIPEYTVRVVKHGQVVHAERVIVGRTSTQTPVFSDEMEQVIFHPFWGVPDSIKKNELLPSLARGSTDVLARSNLRIQYRGRDIDPSTVDWSKADMRKFHVYQPPGDRNVLGVVKFRFPNKHDVYMHDTPTRGLFNASVRTFSHGCMRVRDPLKLAEVVLAEDRNWPAGRVAAAVRSGPKNNQINLEQRVPVHMTYFTVWVNDDGQLKVFHDVYAHESRIASGLEGKAPTLVARAKDTKPPRRTAAAAKPSTTTVRPDWVRRVFYN